MRETKQLLPSKRGEKKKNGPRSLAGLVRREASSTGGVGGDGCN